jgi:hypothetical protein
MYLIRAGTRLLLELSLQRLDLLRLVSNDVSKRGDEHRGL